VKSTNPKAPGKSEKLKTRNALIYEHPSEKDLARKGRAGGKPETKGKTPTSL